jgi:hypothetical protein
LEGLCVGLFVRYPCNCLFLRKPFANVVIKQIDFHETYDAYASRQGMLIQLVGFFAAGLLAANSLFQFALAAGVGWGDMAFGGKVAQDDGTLPNRYRMMSLLSAVFMGFLILVILSASGVVNVTSMDSGFTTWTCRGASVLFALNTFANLASVNKIERWVMGSATILLTASFGLIGW